MLRCCSSLQHLRQIPRPAIAAISQRLYSSTEGVSTELERRGLLADLTASHAIFESFVDVPRPVYCGVDPTAGSLHVGNLLPLLALLHFQLRGHQAIALVGGATAIIGDPSGRDEERPVQSVENVQSNGVEIEKQLKRFFENAQTYVKKRSLLAHHPQQPLEVVNNLSWWHGLSLIDFLHSSGKFVRLNNMLSKESVKSRMATSSGISFAEFSYQLLQAHDFWHLYKYHGCRIQVGGSDQWGNIVAGLDLIVRREPDGTSSTSGKAFGITTPLLTTSTGQKFGKSAGNAIWLDRRKTSVFDFYQFFIRTADADVQKYLNLFTFLQPEDVKAVMLAHRSQPEIRLAQRKLADEITEMIHGDAGVSQARAASKLLFGTGLAEIQPEDAADALRYDPRFYELQETELIGASLTRLASSSGLTRSRAEAVRLVQTGGLYLNNVPVQGTDRKMQVEDLLGNRIAILRAGKDRHVVLALK